MTKMQSYPLKTVQSEDTPESTSSSHTASEAIFDDGSDAGDPYKHADDPLLPTSSPPPAAAFSSRLNYLDEKRQSGSFSSALFFSALFRIGLWILGPPRPRKYKVTPWFPKWQAAPGRAIDRYFPETKKKVYLLLAVLGLWGFVFLSVVHSSVSGDTAIRLACHSNLWSSPTSCGIDGDLCRPFDKAGFAFRCPAGCADAMLLEPYAVGARMYNYRSLVVGGGDSGVYRGDSYICPAAMHAGLISNQKGGCAYLRRTGEHSNYSSTEGGNGISSIEFPSNFPLSFTFDQTESGGKPPSCSDVRWPLFTFSVVVTALLSLCITTPAAFYTSIFFVVYFQVALISDAPYSPNYYNVVSIALGRFLPTAFVGFALYYFCVRHTLTSLDAHWDKTVLWLGGCWVGALNSDTFDKIPLSRLTPHDIQQQPGALTSLISIVSILVLIAITQTIAFRNEGRLPTMLRIYGAMVLAILALLAVPHMSLRLHHYILGLLFIPGTTLQTRPSLLFQGLCLGLFINGIARWDFDSVLETTAALLQGAQKGSPLPQLTGSQVLSNRSVRFNFEVNDLFEGVSVLVNDVERFRTFKYAVPDETGVGSNNSTGSSDNGYEDDDESPVATRIDPFTWIRRRDGEPEFFRFGYVRTNALGGFGYEDFSDPVTWEADGKWTWNVTGLGNVTGFEG